MYRSQTFYLLEAISAYKKEISLHVHKILNLRTEIKNKKHHLKLKFCWVLQAGCFIGQMADGSFSLCKEYVMGTPEWGGGSPRCFHYSANTYLTHKMTGYEWLQVGHKLIPTEKHVSVGKILMNTMPIYAYDLWKPGRFEGRTDVREK